MYYLSCIVLLVFLFLFLLLLLSGRGAARAEDAQGAPAQSHISPSILENEDNIYLDLFDGPGLVDQSFSR